MPDLRAFRALRYDPEVVGDVGQVIAPPYDVIGTDLHRALLARDPRNSVRLDLPDGEAGEDPDERYRRATRTLTTWRTDGTLRKDPRPSVYVYEQAYRVPGTDLERVQRGFFARLRLEPFGPDSGVLPHERTLSGPKEDRYRLLRATNLNTSPVVVLYQDRTGGAPAALDALTQAQPAADLTDDDGVRHRLWVVPAEGNESAAVLLAAAGDGPVFIADGHHRYETALRYRDERLSSSAEEDPAWGYLLTLFLDAEDQLTVLPTHRVVRGIGDDGVAALVDRLGELFTVTPMAGDALVARFEAAGSLAGGDGRFGLLTRAGAYALEAKRGAFAAAGDGSRGGAVAALDVSLLATALERLAGIDADAVARGALGYSKSAAEAARLVAECRDGADAAFLLEPTPVASILAVAREGDVMPQKSTYFFPKALTGLLLNPHEW